MPLVAINTTAGTAAEMTSNAVIIDSARQVKEVIIDPNIIPDIAVDDASVMLDIPASVTAATGMDALTHAVEAYVSVGAHPLTDANALEAIRLINLWLPKAVDNGHDLEAREQMAFGQYLAGMAFNSAGLGLVHALAHQPGATHNLPHGVCNAILLPIIENFNRPNAVTRFARVAQAMGVDTKGMSDETASMEAINAIRALSTRVGDPFRFPANWASQKKISKAGWIKRWPTRVHRVTRAPPAVTKSVNCTGGVMIRKAFVMQVNPDAHEEYQRRHNPIWPELEAALKAGGAHHYAIFLDKARNLLFATVEIESEERWNAVADTEVCQRWWKHMRDVMPANPDNSPVSAELKEVFYLA